MEKVALEGNVLRIVEVPNRSSSSTLSSFRLRITRLVTCVYNVLAKSQVNSRWRGTAPENYDDPPRGLRQQSFSKDQPSNAQSRGGKWNNKKSNVAIHVSFYKNGTQWINWFSIFATFESFVRKIRSFWPHEKLLIPLVQASLKMWVFIQATRQRSEVKIFRINRHSGRTSERDKDLTRSTGSKRCYI